MYLIVLGPHALKRAITFRDMRTTQKHDLRNQNLSFITLLSALSLKSLHYHTEPPFLNFRVPLIGCFIVKSSCPLQLYLFLIVISPFFPPALTFTSRPVGSGTWESMQYRLSYPIPHFSYLYLGLLSLFRLLVEVFHINLIKL